MLITMSHFKTWTLDMKAIAALIFIFTVSGCSLFSRNSDYQSGIYETDPELLDYYHEKKQLEYTQAKGQVRAVASQAEISDEIIERRMLLNRLEQRIPTKKEIDLYYKYKPYFQSNSQRIRFLQIDGHENKIEWLRHYKVTTDVAEFPPHIQAIIDTSDIILGMQKEAVVQSWGEPETKEISGNPTYGNERWKYVKHVPDSANYGLETRYIYFEGGLVSGWKKF